MSFDPNDKTTASDKIAADNVLEQMIYGATADEVAEAAHHVTETANEMVVDSVESVVETTKETVTAVSEDQIRKLKQLGADKAQLAVDHLYDAIPQLEEAGYAMENLYIDIGVMPKVVSRFTLVGEVSEEKREAILAQCKKNFFKQTLLKAMFKATDLREHLKIRDMEFTGLEVHIDGTPKVRLRFCKRLG